MSLKSGRASRLFRRQRLAAWGAGLLAGCAWMAASAATWAENLVVPRGETLVLDSSYADKTSTAVSVSGTLTLSLGSASRTFRVYPTTDPDVLKTTTARTAIDVGPDSGDTGVINVDQAFLTSWPREGVCLADIVVGKNGGEGCVRLNPFGGYHSGYLRTYSLTLNANAQTSADVFDVLTIGASSYVDVTAGHLVNKNAKPMRISFENQENATGYGFIRSYGSNPLFDLSTAGAGGFVLKGDEKAPIFINGWYGYGGPKLFADNAATSGSGCVRTEGACDVIIGCGGASFETYLNATNLVWGHTGNLIFKQAQADAHGKAIIVSVADVLPHGPQTGNVVIRPWAAGATYAQKLRLDKFQQVNGIILENVSSLTNVTASVVPVVFGGGNGSGIASGDFTVSAAKFDYSKAGTGTLSVSNATFDAFVVTGGVLRVAARTSATFNSLAFTNAQLVIERGATLTVGTLAFDQGSVDIQADGVLNATTVQRGTTGVLRNVLPSTLTTNTVSALDANTLSASIPVVKEGAGYTVCRTPADAHGAPLEVQGGILKMGGEVCHNPYWRLIVKKAFIPETRFTDSNYPAFDQTVYLFLGHLGLFAYDGSYSMGDAVDASPAIGTAATALAEGSVTSQNPLFFWNTQTSWRAITNQYPNVTVKTVDPIVGGGTAAVQPRVLVGENATFYDLVDWYDTPGTAPANVKIEHWASCLAFTNQQLKADDPGTWEVVTWRQKAAWAQKGTACYNFQRAVNVENQNRPHPRHWELQSSPDGTTWTTMDEQTNAFMDLGREGLKLNAQFNYTFNRHVPYLLRSTQASWAFNTFGPVQVASGATLDLDEIPEANIAFNGLVVDLTAGAGTITKFAPAANGTLALVNPRAADVAGGRLKSCIALPIAVTKFLSTANLGSWRVTLDGAPASASAVSVENGQLVVTTLNGTLLILR